MWSRTFEQALLIGVMSASVYTAQAAAAGSLIEAPGVQLVRAHCVACHSTQLITQNRMRREGWLDAIRYMQAQHNLWPLGVDEDPILDYLARHYGPGSAARMRRRNLPYLPE